MTAFTPGAEELAELLPSWWATGDPASQLSILLAAAGSLLDEQAAIQDDRSADSSVATATWDGLMASAGFAFGVTAEEAPASEETLRAYLQARYAENGSRDSLIQTLTALLDSEANRTGTEAIFGFTFPADGSGIVLFQDIEQSSMLYFPADGSGILFPAYPDVMASDAYLPDDDSTPPGAGPGLTFPVSGWLDVIENFTTYDFDVRVKSGLAFDRGAFARAVARFRPAHLTYSITEVP